jgi:hypothetical protein
MLRMIDRICGGKAEKSETPSGQVRVRDGFEPKIAAMQTRTTRKVRQNLQQIRR